MSETVRNRWYAATLSYFVPGLGHLHAGRKIRGVLFFLVFALLMGGAAFFVFCPEGDVRGAFVCVPLSLLVYLGALVDAFRVTPRGAEGKDPWLAGFLSYVFPGLIAPGVGQIYLKRTGAGLLFLVLGIATQVAFQWIRVLVFPILTILRGIALWHTQGGLSRQLLWILPLILAEAAIPLGVNWAGANVVTLAQLDDSSMHPAYQLGDRVLLNLCAHLERGDIVLYRDGERLRPGRIVALPGEEVEVRDGQIQVKGEKVSSLVFPIPDADWGGMNLIDGTYLILADRQRLEPESGIPPPVPAERVLGRIIKRVHPFDAPTRD
jgi:signal peptidase I